LLAAHWGLWTVLADVKEKEKEKEKEESKLEQQSKASRNGVENVEDESEVLDVSETSDGTARDSADQRVDKTRDDLRHHAVDAVAIAFCTRSVFQRISSYRKTSDQKVAPLSREVVPPAPEWLGSKLKRLLRDMVVSHETTRQISGALHEETAYGKRKDKTFHYRKPLEVLTPDEINSIVDPKLREAVLRLVGPLDNVKKLNKDQKALLKLGVKIGDTTARRARIVAQITEKAVTPPVPETDPPRFYKLGNYHHVAIFESPDGKKRIGDFVSMLKAARRVRPRPDEEKRALVDTTPPNPGWRFIMWLCKNDTVQMDGKLYLVQRLDRSNERVYLMAATAATDKNNSKPLQKAVNVLRCTKLEVDPIGRVRKVPEGRL
jgi:CRISPR-associated endonuclease Csn1